MKSVVYSAVGLAKKDEWVWWVLTLAVLGELTALLLGFVSGGQLVPRVPFVIAFIATIAVGIWASARSNVNLELVDDGEPRLRFVVGGNGGALDARVLRRYRHWYRRPLLSARQGMELGTYCIVLTAESGQRICLTQLGGPPTPDAEWPRSTDSFEPGSITFSTGDIFSLERALRSRADLTGS